MSQIQQPNSGQAGAPPNPNRRYIIIAAVLLVVIVVAAILLITQGIPALRGEEEPTATTAAQPTATQVPTFTPTPIREATDTPPPALPTTPSLVMSDTDNPVFGFESAGARPSTEWTGFFGEVQDVDGNPMSGVSVIVWYRDGEPASDIVQTDTDGHYEIRLADAPLSGIWTIQLLTSDRQSASKLFTFQTDENTVTGIQHIQVLWKQIP